MKQEDKDLLLRYLSMALPYGVKALVCGWDEEKGEVEVPLKIYSTNTDGYVYFETNKYDVNYLSVEECCLYLRPLSSMTKEELEELNCLCYHNISVQDDILCGYICGIEITDVQNFLLRYHFDFMGLIPKGLAIEVTEENNPYSITEE